MYLIYINKMKNGGIKERLSRALSGLVSEENLVINVEESTQTASSIGIRQCLTQIFGEAIHVICKDTVSLRSQQGFEECIKSIQAAIQSDNGELRKPIVAILDTPWETQEEPEIWNSISSERAHWCPIVILPSNYITCFGTQLNNSPNILFFKDSSAKASLQKTFTSRLAKLEEETGIALFMKLDIIDDNIQTIKQLEYCSDSGWWAMYNACMYLMGGTSSFLDQFRSKVSFGLGNKLRRIFSVLGLDLTLREEPMEAELKLHEDPSFATMASNLLKIKRTQFTSKPGIIYDTTSSDFISLIDDCQNFVDKSLFIRDILERGAPQHLMILRPRKWGKSLIISMLYEFLKADVDMNGKIQKHNKNYNLFETGKFTNSRGIQKSIKQLEIARVEYGLYLELEGYYPVIYITFRKVDNSSIDDPSLMRMRKAIKSAYKNHQYMSPILEAKIKTEESPFKRELIENDLKIFKQYSCADPQADLEESIVFLAELLYKYLKRRVYIIIDEFDTPYNGLYVSNYTTRQSEITTSMLYNALKPESNKNFLEKGILVGVFQIPLGSLGSYLNNLSICNVLSPKFPEHFGFTKSETLSLIDEGFEKSQELEDHKKELKRWYNGYRIRSTKIYNPWAIMNTLSKMTTQDDCSMESFLVQSRSTDILKQKIEEIYYSLYLEQLFRQGCVCIRLPDLNLSEKTRFQDTQTELCKLFLLLGYITKTKLEGLYRIPNNEVRLYVYKEFFPVWIKARFKIQEEFKLSTLSAGLADNLENLRLYIEVLQDNILSKFHEDTHSAASFQSLLGGFAMLASAELPNHKHSVYSETTDLYLNRFDSLFIPVANRSDTWIIHQYKELDSNNTLLQTMENAFWQIYAQRYLSVILGSFNPNSSAFIVTRAIVFYKPGLGTWRAEARGFRHTIEQGQLIHRIFSTEENKVLPTGDILSGRYRDTEKARRIFLETYGVESIYDLLLQFAVEENQDQIVVGENERKKIQKTDETLRNVMIGQIEIEKGQIETNPRNINK